MFRNSVEQLLGELCSELAYVQIEDLISAGLHEYLDQLQTKMNRVGTGISETFFATRVAVPIRKKAKKRAIRTVPGRAYRMRKVPETSAGQPMNQYSLGHLLHERTRRLEQGSGVGAAARRAHCYQSKCAAAYNDPRLTMSE